MTRARFSVAIVAALAVASLSPRRAVGSPKLPPGPLGWHDAGHPVVRGVTIGPIENTYHPAVGYGTPAFYRTLVASKEMGATWISLTPFGRVGDLAGRGVDPTFEAPHDENRAAIRRSIEWAHALGLKVLLVPHLWIESGEWRALVDPKTDAGWAQWEASYGRFVLDWAEIAESTHTEMFSAGVELRSWVTSARAPSFVSLLRTIRGVYHGLLTYSANWDDVETTVPLGDLDVIGINAFYPLADHDGAGLDALLRGGERVRDRVHALAGQWQRPVLFTEIGYTTRPNPAVKPWEWPDHMKGVVVDQKAQADAYRGLLAALTDEPAFAGFFVWRLYSDLDDVSQEAEWGFSPRAKLAERVMRDAFRVRWAGERDAWFFQDISRR